MPGHTFRGATTDENERQKFAVLLHPPYSSSLTPREFHFLPKLQKDSRGHCCASNEEAERTTKT